MCHARLFLYSFLVVLITSCVSPEKTAGSDQAVPLTKKQKSENADIFGRKGQYETESSFRRRQAAVAKAGEFFESIGRENCVVKVGLENVCHRAIDNGYYQTYSNGVIQSHDRWKRVNNAFCEGNSCQPVTVYTIQSFSEYSEKYQVPEADTESKNITELRSERAELTVRSMICYKCARGHWQRSVASIFLYQPNCTFELNKHKVQYGALNINNLQVAISEEDEGRSNFFLAAVETPHPEHITKVFIRGWAAKKSENCKSELELVRKL